MEFLGLEYYKDSPIDSKTKQNISTIKMLITWLIKVILSLWFIVHDQVFN